MPVYYVFQFAIIWRVIADACAALDALGLGGSDPLHYIWAAKPRKTGGRYRPNWGFWFPPKTEIRFFKCPSGLDIYPSELSEPTATFLG